MADMFLDLDDITGESLDYDHLDEIEVHGWSWGLTHRDRGALATYCGAYALWSEAMIQIQKYGTMVK